MRKSSGVGTHARYYHIGRVSIFFGSEPFSYCDVSTSVIRQVQVISHGFDLIFP